MMGRLSKNEHFQVMGVILAGGLSQRMGQQEKSQLKLENQTFIEHVYTRLSPQVDSICISTNQSLTLPAAANTPQIPDKYFKLDGPMAGIYNAALFAQKEGYSHLLVTPVDAPFLPSDWRKKMNQADLDLTDAVVTPNSDNRKNHLFQWMPLKQTPKLESWLKQGGRAAKDWLNNVSHCSFAYEESKANNFTNINTPEEYQSLLSLS